MKEDVKKGIHAGPAVIVIKEGVTKWLTKTPRKKSICLWLSENTVPKYDEMIKRVEDHNWLVHPVFGDFTIMATYKIIDTFFDDAEKLGVPPLDYALERLEISLNAYNSDDKIKKGIFSIERKREKTIETIDTRIIQKVKSISGR